MKEKKKKSIFLYFIGIFFLFIMVFFAQQLFLVMMQNGLFYYKFGIEAISEILWAGLVLIVVLLFKNKYIFTQEREDFFYSFKYIIPELILSAVFFLFSIISIITNQGVLDISSILNLALYCLFIGIVEELLCRGWILNEFLERYSDTKKEIRLSILFSSLVFGLIHFANVGSTQGVVESFVQVMNATVSGIFLALVYYKTKNIWIVITSHAIWDFSLMLGEVNSLGECIVGTASNTMIITNVIRGIALSFAYLCLCYWLYCKTDLYEKNHSNNKNYLIVLGVIIYLLSLFFLNYTEEDYYTCPNYEFKKIENNYKDSYYHYDSYQLEDYNLTLKKEEKTNKLILINEKGDSIDLIDDNQYYDYLLIENEDSFSIMIQTSYNAVLYQEYAKQEIENTKEYLTFVKDSLTQYVVSDIEEIGVLEYPDTEYHYPLIKDKQTNILYFDIDGKIYMDR